MSDAVKGETITKLDLAKRELSQAIYLFLEDKDPVTYYQLAFTSHEIIRNIANAKGIKSILKDDSVDMINEEGLDTVLEKRYGEKYKSIKKKDLKEKIKIFMNYDYNNIKHSGSNADEEVTIHWDVAQIVMVDSIEMLRRLGESLSSEHIALMLWTKKRAPEVYNGTNMTKALEYFEENIDKVDKDNLLRFVGDFKKAGLEDLLNLTKASK